MCSKTGHFICSLQSFRKGLTFIQIMDMFATEELARRWFESIVWPNGPECPHCGSRRASECKDQRPQPYRCKDCRKHFSVKHGTVMHRSPLTLRQWAIAIYMCSTNLKSVSSMKLHRDLGITQKSAWFMMHRIREAFPFDCDPFDGPVEVDESYFGALEKNKHKKDKLNAGRGAVGKTPVAGIKDRKSNKVKAEVVENVDGDTMRKFIAENATAGAKVYTDDSRVYSGLPHEREVVRHSVGEYVRQQAHTNGIESFWALLKRAHDGTFHKMSPKHLNRYVEEFVGRFNTRCLNTDDIMRHIVAGMIGKRLTYRKLINA